jgi:hypothetical protein
MSCCQTQVDGFLRWAHHIHLAAQDYFEDIEPSGLGPRVVFCIEYLLGQEARLAHQFNQGLKTTPEAILHSFVEIKSLPALDSTLLFESLGDRPTTDQISSAVFGYRDAVIALFKEAALLAADKKAQALFSQIVSVEESERNHLASALMQLGDL